MKQFNNFKKAQESARFAPGEKLPVGAYVCQVIAVKYENGKDDNSDMIKLQFDVAEGDFKDFFRNKYNAEQREDKKFKGMTTIYVPKDDGSEKDGWTMNTFAKWTNAFEDSNPGYSWDWNEQKWKGLMVGIVFGETGSVIEGKAIKYTEARIPCDVNAVRDGRAPKAKFKAKNGWSEDMMNNQQASDDSAKTDENGFMKIPDGVGEEFPF